MCCDCRLATVDAAAIVVREISSLFFQAEDGIRDIGVTGVQTCALPISQDTKEKEGFVFTTVKENPITSIKNQNRSSTCWSFSGLGFLESELLRTGKGEYDLSEMFVVHKTMQDRSEEHTSELQSRQYLVCRLLLEKKKNINILLT